MYAIVGAGPAGLTLAWLLAKSGKSCVVFDREAEIGGCHRVLRVNGLFTEHSPRLYVSSYLNFRWLLKDMGVEDPFVPYEFGVKYLARQLLKKLSIRETLYLALTYFLFLINPNFGKTTSVADWCCSFSPSSRDYLDRLCRFTDGAGADRYPIVKLLQLANQNFFYQLYQLRQASDVGLFRQIGEKLLQTGRVTFRLSSNVDSISSGSLTAAGETLSFEKILLCIPPLAALPLLGQSLQRVVESSTYDPYISATFHYRQPVEFKTRWGFPSSEWGLISVPTSKYTSDLGSQAVFSVTCMFLDRKSSVTNKTLNETTDQEELLSEMFRQLKETYPELPPPDVKILSPTAYYVTEGSGGETGEPAVTTSGWHERDSAYIQTTTHDSAPFETNLSGVFHIGTHNLQSSFAYTTLEAAVTNAMAWFNERSETERVVIQNPLPVSRVIRLVVFLLVLYRLAKGWMAK
jgi:hypothetical protein